MIFAQAAVRHLSENFEMEGEAAQIGQSLTRGLWGDILLSKSSVFVDTRHLKYQLMSTKSVFRA